MNYVRNPGIQRVHITNELDSYVYGCSFNSLPGVVAANVFFSFMNPIGSGKTVRGGLLTVYNSATGATTVTTPMTFNRIASHSGGVDSSASIVAYDPTGPATISQVRLTNPTTTGVGSDILSIAPPISAGISQASTLYQFPAPSGYFVIPPGTGLQLRTAGGTVNQLWSITASWIEV